MSFIDSVGDKIDHLHLSDYNEFSDCLPPLEGKENYPQLINALRAKGYSGDFIIELYRKNFDDSQQIVDAGMKFDKILL